MVISTYRWICFFHRIRRFHSLGIYIFHKSKRKRLISSWQPVIFFSRLKPKKQTLSLPDEVISTSKLLLGISSATSLVLASPYGWLLKWSLQVLWMFTTRCPLWLFKLLPRSSNLLFGALFFHIIFGLHKLCKSCQFHLALFFSAFALK